MMQNMMPGVGSFALFWISIGILLCLVLVAAFIWFFVRWLNSRRTSTMQHASQPQDSDQMYEQGYRPAEPLPETYQEGGQQYLYSPRAQYEQPQAQYPQETPLQH